jgi:DNA polymerase III psi subunit
MENTSHLVLSEYQRAILNEMGICSWQLVTEQQTPVKDEIQTFETITTPSKVVTKVDALAKLKQLKTQSQKNEVPDTVLISSPQSDSKLQIFTDVLMALELDDKQQKHISTDQLDHYSDYALSWRLGDKISFEQDKQLITPALAELYHADSKKQLWQQLQKALEPVKI